MLCGHIFMYSYMRSHYQKVYHSGNALDVHLKDAWFEFGPVIVCPK